MTSDRRSTEWRSTTLGSEAVSPGGVQTGPFGNQLHASEYTPEGVPVILPKNLEPDGISTTRIARIPESKAQELSRYRVREGDVVVARRGTLGRSARIDRQESGWVCGTGCIRLRLSEAVDSEYLAQYLRWRRTAFWLESHAVGQTMLNLNTQILSGLPLHLPDLALQGRHVEALSSVDLSLRNTRDLIDQENRFLSGMVSLLIRGGVYQVAHQGPRQSAWLAAEGVRAAPKSWRICCLGDLCHVQNGYRFSTSEWSDAGLPILRIRNLHGSQKFKYFAGYAKPEWIVEPGELLFAWAGSPGSLGPCRWEGPRGVLNQHIFRVRPQKGVNSDWLHDLLLAVAPEIEASARGFKSSLIHVRKRDFLRLEVALPSLAEQEEIANRTAHLRKGIRLHEETLQGLTQLKMGLMDDLFSNAAAAPGASRYFPV